MELHTPANAVLVMLEKPANTVCTSLNAFNDDDNFKTEVS